MRYRAIRFQEADYVIRSMTCAADRLQSYRLRHAVFSRSLRWVPPDPRGLEIDHHDQRAIPLGVFDGHGSLVGMVRFLPSDQPFMLEAEFAQLMAPGYRVRKASDTVEISRLAVIPDLHPVRRGPSRLAILLKALYQWSVINDIRYAYMEVERRFFRVLRVMGFPCEPIGPFTTLPPAGAESVAAVLDWSRFRSENACRRPGFLAWMATVQGRVARSPGRSRVPASTHAVLSEYSEYGT